MSEIEKHYEGVPTSVEEVEGRRPVVWRRGEYAGPGDVLGTMQCYTGKRFQPAGPLQSLFRAVELPPMRVSV